MSSWLRNPTSPLSHLLARKNNKQRRKRNSRFALMQQLEDRRLLAVTSPPAASLPTVHDPVAVALGMFNNDSRQDAVILGSAGDVTLATGGGDDNWQMIRSFDLGIGPQQTLISRRLTADPFTDLITQSAEAITVLHSDGAGGFTTVQTLTAPSGSGLAVSQQTANSLSVDFVNNDAFPDLVAVAGADGSVLIYPGAADGQFGSPTVYWTGIAAPTTAVVADVIGDDLPDLVVGHEDGAMAFFEGVAVAKTASFQRRDDLARTESSTITAMDRGDFDLDGNDDLAVATTTDAFVLFSSDDPYPVSALVNGNFSAGLTGWETEIVGHASGTTPGRVVGLGGAAQLSENESFLTSLKQTIVIPAGAQSLSFDLIALGLDPIAGGVPDALEVSLLDADQQSLVPTHHPQSTAFFNISAGDAASAAPGVTVSGSMITLDISALATGSAATVLFDLIGNPPGSSSVATIDDVTITPGAVRSDVLNRVSLTGPFGTLADLVAGDVDGDGQRSGGQRSGGRHHRHDARQQLLTLAARRRRDRPHRQLAPSPG